MKIAVNTRFLLKNKMEGIGWFTHEVMKRMVAQHPEDEFFFFFDRPYHRDFIFGDNVVPVVLLPPARHPLLFLWWFEWAVARTLDKLKPDVFLSTDNFLSLRSKVPTLLITHDLAHLHFPEQLTFCQKKYHRFFIRKFNHRASRIVTVSEFTKTDLIRQYQILPEKIAVGCNGCRETFKPLPGKEIQRIRDQYAEGQPYFFFVGAVHPRKNMHRLIIAFDQFKKNTGAKIKLLIAGRFAWKAGDVLDAYQTAIHRQDIHFLGYTTDETLPKLMGAAFACTYVSLFEGFGLPLLEAMNCDVPIITSNGSSMPEVAGNAGLLVSPESTEEIASAMQQIWQNTHLYQQLVENGRKQRTLFTWQRATEVVYENLKLAISLKK